MNSRALWAKKLATQPFSVEEAAMLFIEEFYRRRVSPCLKQP